MTSPTDEHADKYNDPRAVISRRGILLGVFVVLFGIGGAALSIWARRTHLEKSTEFWGTDYIMALQLAEEVELFATVDQPDSELGSSSEPVRLSGMPGLGHLRHVLLDDRSYQWDTVTAEPIRSRAGKSPCMMLRLTDPTVNRFPEAVIVIDLENGWIGKRDGQNQVQLTERYQTAMPVFLKQIANYEPQRVEMREKQ